LSLSHSLSRSLYALHPLSPGLLYVIETQKVLDLNVNLMASYVIIPQTGFYSGAQNVILLDLGHFKVRRG